MNAHFGLRGIKLYPCKQQAQMPFLMPRLAIFLFAFAFASPVVSENPNADPLARIGVTPGQGTAHGYVEDTACRLCHQEKYESYQAVGMAQSFAHASDARRIEAFGQTYFHSPSQRYYSVHEANSKLTFRRWQLDDDGKQINLLELPIDWVLGSGNKARSYLFQTEWGEIYQLPVGWYTEDQKWAMSPGFESANHMGVRRIVRRECMFCHNAYPEMPVDSDAATEPHRFPTDLPSGTGCQRCHGPGASHIKTALSGSTLAEVQGKIVNPAKLPPDERDSVCFQCHMLPSVSVIGTRRAGADTFSFRPGQLLTDYLVSVETSESEPAQADGFEINHHGYRLYQSQCYRKGDRALTCISCHDPHRKPQSTTFRAAVADVCTECHQTPLARHSGIAHSPMNGCVDCHMPTRRTRDVIEVTMTDHKIARGPFDSEQLTAPLEKQLPNLSTVEVLNFATPPVGDEGRIYAHVSLLRKALNTASLQELDSLLAQSGPGEVALVAELVRAQLAANDLQSAERTILRAVSQVDSSFRLHNLLGSVYYKQGRFDDGAAAFETSLRLQPNPEAHYNLGLIEYRAGKFDSALRHMKQAVKLRPVMQQAWVYLGLAQEKLGDQGDARESYIRALAIDPGLERAYLELVRLLREMGDLQQAARYLSVGRRVASSRVRLDGMDLGSSGGD